MDISSRIGSVINLENRRVMIGVDGGRNDIEMGPVQLVQRIERSIYYFICLLLCRITVSFYEFFFEGTVDIPDLIIYHELF